MMVTPSLKAVAASPATSVPATSTSPLPMTVKPMSREVKQSFQGELDAAMSHASNEMLPTAKKVEIPKKDAEQPSYCYACF